MLGADTGFMRARAAEELASVRQSIS